MSRNRALAVLGVLLFSLLACNLTNPQGELPGLVATVTAQALTLQALATPTETPTEVPGTSTATAVTGVEVSVTSRTNCRTGPSTAFDLVLTVDPGQAFKVLGKNTPTGYWIIDNPAGDACWLWGQYAVVTGDPGTLPEYPAPDQPQAKATKTPKASNTPGPTATATSTLGPSAPADPSGFQFTRTCTGYLDGVTPKWRENITFTWQDNADNESGFKLYQGNSVLQTLPANRESTYAELTYNQGTGGPLFDNYQLVAFNDAGGSFGGAVDVPRCP